MRPGLPRSSSTSWPTGISEDDRAAFLAGLADVDARSVRVSGEPFIDGSRREQMAVVRAAGVRRLAPGDSDGFWARFKALTLYGFYNSAAGRAGGAQDAVHAGLLRWRRRRWLVPAEEGADAADLRRDRGRVRHHAAAGPRRSSPSAGSAHWCWRRDDRSTPPPTTPWRCSRGSCRSAARAIGCNRSGTRPSSGSATPATSGAGSSS